jgi:hypothetical protein
MTRLTGIILENFKAFKKRRVIPIHPITLIFGPNSGGKSSIIHALALLKHAFVNNGHAEADVVDVGWSEVRLGGWQNLIHGHDGNSTFKIGLQFEGDRTPHQKPSQGTDLWEIVWEFGRINENSEATVTAISALLNGHSEFNGTWNHGRSCWSIRQLPSSLHAQLFSPERFWEDLVGCLKQSASMAAEEGGTPLKEWLTALGDSPVVIGGFFPNCKLERKSVGDEYHERLPLDARVIFLRHLFLPESSYTSDRDWTWEGAQLLSGIAKIKAGMPPTNEETTALREVYAHWSAHVSESEPPYEAAALSFEKILKNHSHLDSVRERPKYALNLRDLPHDPKYSPWKKLISDDNLREQASTALEIITRQPGQRTGYRLAKRNRIVEIRGKESSQSIKSTTSELAISNPQGQLMGIEDVGYGISTVLPIITAMNFQKRCINSVEQPELHIHPRLQTELGDMLLRSSLGNDNTLLIETHSEHLILRILRRIRETTEQDFSDWPEELKSACPNGIRQEDVAVLYVEPGEEGAQVTELPITPDGDFSRPWPSGFFTERSKELF